ncbi:MAG: hypothetical protein ABIV04_10680 [Massilia sp.]
MNGRSINQWDHIELRHVNRARTNYAKKQHSSDLPDGDGEMDGNAVQNPAHGQPADGARPLFSYDRAV